MGKSCCGPKAEAALDNANLPEPVAAAAPQDDCDLLHESPPAVADLVTGAARQSTTVESCGASCCKPKPEESNANVARNTEWSCSTAMDAAIPRTSSPATLTVPTEASCCKAPETKISSKESDIASPELTTPAGVGASVTGGETSSTPAMPPTSNCAKTCCKSDKPTSAAVAMFQDVRRSALDSRNSSHGTKLAVSKQVSSDTVSAERLQIQLAGSANAECCPRSSVEGDEACSQETCLNSLAFEECRASSHTRPSSTSSEVRKRTPLRASAASFEMQRGIPLPGKRQACEEHRRSVLDRYKAFLTPAECFCKRVFGQTQPDCCKPRRLDGSHILTSSREISLLSSSKSSLKLGNKDCKQLAPSLKGPRSQIFSHRLNSGVELKNCQEGQTCVADDGIVLSTVGKSSSNARSDTKPSDVESKPYEHVMISVGGMTCSGCTRIIQRALEAMPGICGVRVNLMQESAEFDTLSDSKAVDDTIREAARITGFSLKRMVINNWNELIEVVVVRGSAEQTVSSLPDGVQVAEILSSTRIKIEYDPTVIGARSLIAALGPSYAGLAAVRDPILEIGKRRLLALAISTTLAAIMTIPVVVLAWGSYNVREDTAAIVSLILATGVQAIALREFYLPALRLLFRSSTVEMDMLVCISITAAYVYSVVAFGFTISGSPLGTKEFFETSTLLITLVLLGRLIAGAARVRAVASVSIRSLQANSASVLEDGQTKELDLRLLQLGDTLLIRPHTQVATDCIVIEGTGEVDESLLTGEPLPVAKRPGMHLVAATLNGNETLIARLTRLPGKSTVMDIAKLVENASNSKPAVQDVADRIAKWFIPVVGFVAVSVFVIWILVARFVRLQSAGRSVVTGLTYAISVLAISCPCALGLAVPMVLVVANGIAARQGVVIKTAAALDLARKITDVVFDKTGTVTTDELDVVAEELLGDNKNKTLALARALTQANGHPVSAAVAAHLQLQGSTTVNLSNIRVIPGSGVEAVVGMNVVQAGNAEWLGFEKVPEVEQLLKQGMTILCIAKSSQLLAVYGLKTRLRPESSRVINELQKRRITIHLVSGDNFTAVHKAAADLGIDTSNVSAKTSPRMKQTYVQKLLHDPQKTVLFCGDGTNDAVAIAQAHVGVQLGSASEVTRASADVIILGGLDGLLTFIDVSKSAFLRIVFNFIWSLVYNVVAVLLASGALVVFNVPPAYAGLGEMVSVLPVIVVGLSMLLFKGRCF